jgi:hypothetical protein
VANHPDETSAREEIGRYIETYHRSRPHQALFNFTPAHVHELNNKSALLGKLTELKRTNRERRKAYWAERSRGPMEGGYLQVRVGARSLILGLIRKKYLNDNSQICRTRGMMTKNTDPLIFSSLSHLKTTGPLPFFPHPSPQRKNEKASVRRLFHNPKLSQCQSTHHERYSFSLISTIGNPTLNTRRCHAVQRNLLSRCQLDCFGRNYRQKKNGLSSQSTRDAKTDLPLSAARPRQTPAPYHRSPECLTHQCRLTQ